MSVLFLHRQSPGDLLEALRMDVSRLRLVVRGLASVVLESMLALGLVGIAIWISPWLSFLAFCVLPLLALPIVYAARRMRERSNRMRVTGYVLFDILMQILIGIRVIKAYRAEEREARLSYENGNKYFDESIEMVRLRSSAQILLESLSGLGIVLVIIAGSFQVLSRDLTWPGLFAFLMAARALQGPLNMAYNAFMEVQTYAASVNRIAELLSARSEVYDRPNAQPLRSNPQRITFDNVSFSYGDGPVLSDLSFELQAGETLGIVGPSGVGKSTLLNLFVRFYEPTAGRVLYDGRNLQDFRMASIYDKVAIVTQDPFLFATSLRDNIRIGRPTASDAEVEEAARSAYIHDDIAAMPQGYDTVVGIGGRALSRGQSQRLNLARAFLKDAPILLLDEATSSLDCVAEAEILWALDRLMKGRTNVMVTHQFGNLRNVDRILVLGEGRCAGLGTHEELLRDCPLYHRMSSIQGYAETLS
jgi:ABC-type multidrug transport system fused ATPase/permease subunit